MYKVDVHRAAQSTFIIPETGLYVKAELFGHRRTWDIRNLTKESLLDFLKNEGAEKVLLNLLKHY